jgi:phosphate-selective porin OprO/OprP
VYFKKGVLLVLAAAWLATPSLAQTNPQLDRLEQQLRDVQQQLAQIRHKPDDAALADLRRSTAAQHADIEKRLAARPRVGTQNGRLTFASADGDFSLSLRALIQFDTGYFAQGKNPPGIDLNSGTNFRRAQFGFFGTAWRDWSYNFTYDFGGHGVEKRGYVYIGTIEYDGFKPFGFRIGAFPPPAGLDDATPGADLAFLERAASADMAGNIAGAPGREGAGIFAQGDRYFLSASLTGKRTLDAATFDAQQAVVTRAAWLAVDAGDVKWVLDAGFTRVFKVADTAPNSNANSFNLAGEAELTVDGSKTVDTGAVDAKGVTAWGLETALNDGPFHVQGGYFHYAIARRLALPDPDFSGWYAFATWSLTGESHLYDPTVAIFRGLRPDHPLGTPGGWGAFELKARFSNLDLEYQPLLAGGVAGGNQNIWTVGMNWIPVPGLRFALDYSNIAVSHAGAPANDISANAIALRSQIAL